MGIRIKEHGFQVLINYLVSEGPQEVARVLDEAIYDVVMNAEESGTTEGISQRYYTLRQLRDIIKNLNQEADGNI